MANKTEQKQAFLIIAHNEPYILETLVKLLDYHMNDIYIHIDKKVNNKIFNLEAKYSKIYFLKDRINIKWGGVSQIKTELSIFKEALNHDSYKYFHLLSGVDLPLKSGEYIYNYFNKLDKPIEFIEVSDNEPNTFQIKYKTGTYHFFHYNGRNKIIKYINYFFQLFQIKLFDIISVH